MAETSLWFFAGVLVGLVIGVGLGLAAARVRAGVPVSTAAGGAHGRGPMPNTLVGPSARQPDDLPPVPLATPADPPGVRRVRQRVEVSVGPTGLQLTVDGRRYSHLAEIADPLALDEARMALRVAAQSVTSPSHRAAIEQELRQAGG